MALIVESKYTSPWSLGVPYRLKDIASEFQFNISASVLSKPYSLKDGDFIEGAILKIEDQNKKEYTGLRNRSINLILYSVLGLDYLFLSKTDWEEIREYGLVFWFYLTARLEKAKKVDGSEIDLYTKADLKA